jgi:hypothetical protein
MNVFIFELKSTLYTSLTKPKYVPCYKKKTCLTKIILFVNERTNDLITQVEKLKI